MEFLKVFRLIWRARIFLIRNSCGSCRIFKSRRPERGLKSAAARMTAQKIINGTFAARLIPESLRPFLTASNAARGFAIAKFTAPPALDVDVRGRLYDYDSIDANGRVALTNFTVRGEMFGDAASALNYTNRVLEFLNPVMHNGAQMMTADKVTLDFNTRLIYFTNVFSTADPETVARAIGPKTGELLKPYHFLKPPTVRVNGCSPIRDIHNAHDAQDANLRFDILNPTPFQWLKLKTPGIMGTIQWLAGIVDSDKCDGGVLWWRRKRFCLFRFSRAA